LGQVNSLVQESGGAVLALLEQLCGDDPPRTNECLGEVVSGLVRVRDQLIAARRAGAPCSEELRRTNAILSSVFGIEFPISGRQWTRVCEARNALKDMLHGQRAPG
jgi:hypothetical protein